MRLWVSQMELTTIFEMAEILSAPEVNGALMPSAAEPSEVR